MPQLNPLSAAASASALHIVTKNNTQRHAFVLQRRQGEIYVHYANTDKRMDEWVPDDFVRLAEDHEQLPEVRGRKRKRADSREHPAVHNGGPSPSLSATPPRGEDLDDNSDSDLSEHRLLTAKRNFDKVNFGQWQMKTWYFSPYPVTEAETDDAPVTTQARARSVAPAGKRPPGVNRTSLRAHGRTADLVAGGLNRDNVVGDTTLWVCDRCFKYMREGTSWELHTKNCQIKNPPGRKVYQRGTHTIWEVDGALEKLYCQNLSLFGKLFIDVKTLFFDSENFMFYILTDAQPRRDHVLGFFSKEKVSFDDYNLACIVILPPYQKKRYGMLLIEFSYELSRRSAKVGTPERPLSDLGLRSYVTYWITVLVGFFRRLLNVSSPDDDTRSKKKKTGDSPAKTVVPITADGKVDPPGFAAGLQQLSDTALASMRTTHAYINRDGSVTTHMVIRCTLQDIANATNIRVEDVAFAMRECGFLTRRQRPGNDGQDTEVVVISREMVEAVADARQVKKMCLDLAHVLL